MYLTPAEREVLRQLDIFITDNGLGPSDTILGMRCGFTNSNASHVRAQLKKKGALTFKRRFPRTTRITDAGRAALDDLRGNGHPTPEPVAEAPRVRVEEVRPPAVEPKAPRKAQDLRDRAICLLVDAHVEGATEFGNALGSILSLIP